MILVQVLREESSQCLRLDAERQAIFMQVAPFQGPSLAMVHLMSMTGQRTGKPPTFPCPWWR